MSFTYVEREQPASPRKNVPAACGCEPRKTNTWGEQGAVCGGHWAGLICCWALREAAVGAGGREHQGQTGQKCRSLGRVSARHLAWHRGDPGLCTSPWGTQWQWPARFALGESALALSHFLVLPPPPDLKSAMAAADTRACGHFWLCATSSGKPEAADARKGPAHWAAGRREWRLHRVQTAGRSGA